MSVADRRAAEPIAGDRVSQQRDQVSGRDLVPCANRKPWAGDGGQPVQAVAVGRCGMGMSLPFSNPTTRPTFVSLLVKISPSRWLERSEGTAINAVANNSRGYCV